MSDFLIQLGQNARARQIIKSLGLPIPMPQRLQRSRGPREQRPLGGQVAIFGAAPGGELGDEIARTLVQAGADTLVVGAASLLAPFAETGEAFGQLATQLSLDAPPDRLSADSLIFDASGVRTTPALRALYDFFHPLIRRLVRCGRVVVLGRPLASCTDAAWCAAQAALDGFVRSLSKEIGKRGSTAQLIRVEPGAEDRLVGVLRFVLSARSAFVTGQPLTVTGICRDDAGEQIWVRPLEGKVALVTGAARGIGAATARLMASEGAHVVCLDRPADDGPLSRIAREVGGDALPLDIAGEEAPSTIAEELQGRHGGVDVVVHNAGITRDRTLGKMKEQGWSQAIDVNLSAVIRVTDELTRGVLREGGRVICLSSVAGIAGNMGQTNYAASKAGLIGFVKQLASDLSGQGIAVNAVAPGFIETRMTRTIPLLIREAGRRLSSLGQGGLPPDVGEVITFLATPGAAGLTGAVIRVCGGSLIGA